MESRDWSSDVCSSDLYEERTPFAHGFPKLPVLYAYRPESYCKKIKTFRVRLEKLLSNYADCIDYHFFPLLKLIGDVEAVSYTHLDVYKRQVFFLIFIQQVSYSYT